MRVLVACEFSGEVRRAFRQAGHEAFSCDLEPSEDVSEHHYQCDVRELISGWTHWDLMIAFPPCTYLASSGARWFAQRQAQQFQALAFVDMLLQSPIKRIALENPIGKISTAIRKPDQIIQPWQFGHGETKATCLWLKNLAPLRATEIVPGRASRIHKMPESKTRSRERSRTYSGIARAMAQQWGTAHASNYYRSAP